MISRPLGMGGSGTSAKATNGKNDAPRHHHQAFLGCLRQMEKSIHEDQTIHQIVDIR